jgi:signal transduction histidine kinase
MVVLGALVTLVVVAVPGLRLAVDSAAAGAIVVTARAMAELVGAALAAQRFGRTASRLDFGIAVGLGVMAGADVVYAVGRATLAPDAVSAVPVLPYQLVGAGVLVAAALAPDRPLSRRARQRPIIVAVAMSLVALLVMHAARLLPAARLVGGDEPVDVVLLRIAACALLAVGAIAFAFAGRRRRGRDDLIRWLAAALALSALAQLERIAVAPGAATAFTWASVLQLGAAGALLTGAIQEVRTYQRQIAELAVHDERRRIARDLHDGLAQELAFIVNQTRYLADRSDDQHLELVASSAQRALDDSRFVIGALTRASGQRLGASLALQAQEFARRWGLTVELEIEEDLHLAPEKEHAVLRIVGEALSNAARHAEASTVAIRMGGRDGRLHVAVHDDGRGFDLEAEGAAASGFGLRSMRERVELLGGDLRLESEPGRGTRVEFALA